MLRFSLLGVWITLGRLVNGAPVATGCDREALLAAADRYVEAQMAESMKPLQELLDGNFTYRENNKQTVIPDGVISRPLAIDHRRSTADTTNCATFTELISSTGAEPYVIGTQIRHDRDAMTITLVDSVAATTGVAV